MENPDNEDIIIQIEETHAPSVPLTKYHHYFFLLSSHVLFTMCWPCAFICWWCCNLLTSNQDLWLVRDKLYRDPFLFIYFFSISQILFIVSWSLLYIIEHVLSQSVYHATSKSCMIQSNSTVYTVFFGLRYLLYRVTGALESSQKTMLTFRCK